MKKPEKTENRGSKLSSIKLNAACAKATVLNSSFPKESLQQT
ncbi:hypothetical protein [Gymnodinialimonas ceratoperidinii]|nr:hypothetical protein [Gymnodinialimonas ceratoperidinii]